MSDGEHTEKLRESTAVSDEKLVNTVEERLANLNAITKDTGDQADDVEENDESTPDKDDEEQDDSQDDDQADKDDDSDESTPDKDGGSDKEDDKELPTAFLRAAIHRGWKEEDAQEFFKDNPDAAIKTFQNCYMDVNNASREWAAIGKQKAEQNAQKIVAPEAAPKVGTVDVAKLKADYDLDDAVVAHLEKQQAALTELEQQPAQQPQPQETDAPDPNVQLEIENFFNAEVLSAYDKFYGKLELGQNWADLSAGQRDNRYLVLNMADHIILGRAAANLNTEGLDALEAAHMIVSEPIREQVIRESITKTATKRKKSMTLRPSDGTRSTKKVASDSGGKSGTRSKEELRVAVQEKLNSVFH